MLLFFACMLYTIVLDLGPEHQFSPHFHIDYYFYESGSLFMALITFVAACHIHKNSRQVERLGIRTNSLVMKIYVIFLIIFALCTFSSTTLTSINSSDEREHEDDNAVHTLRIVTAASAFLGLRYFLMSSLELLMLYAYYCMS